jgi:uncharacterized protein (TIGR02217 family)
VGEFVDIYMPGKVAGAPWISSPQTRTKIIANAGGSERRNQDWEHPLMRFVAPEAIAREWSVVWGLIVHWRIMRGPHRSWPARDPMDFSSCDLTRPNQVPTPSATDQAIGTGDGFTERFQLTKTYSLGPETYVRTVHLPVLASVIVAVDGIVADPATYTVSRPGGVVQFVTAPDEDAEITAGFLFDVEVRFESDDALEAILRAHRAAGFADLTLIEVRPC